MEGEREEGEWKVGGSGGGSSGGKRRDRKEEKEVVGERVKIGKEVMWRERGRK